MEDCVKKRCNPLYASQSPAHFCQENPSNLGRTIAYKSPPINVRTTPWSKVIRFETSKGSIYLKQMPAALSLKKPPQDRLMCF